MFTKEDLLKTVDDDDITSFEVCTGEDGEMVLYIASCSRGRLPEKYWSSEFLFDGTKKENIALVKSLAEKIKAKWIKEIEWDLDSAVKRLEKNS
jgi:hypothetical protein